MTKVIINLPLKNILQYDNLGCRVHTLHKIRRDLYRSREFCGQGKVLLRGIGSVHNSETIDQ